MPRSTKIVAVATVALAATLTGVYQYGTHLLMKEQARATCDDIFELARSIQQENRSNA